MRDPNERMLMGSLGVDSPMFDFVEQISGRPTPMPITEKDKKKKQRMELEKQAKNLEDKDDMEEEEMQYGDDNEDDQTLARATVDP